MRLTRIALLATTLLAAQHLPALAQDGDADLGRRVYAQCRACHLVDDTPRNTVGPNLWGMVDRRAASRENFRYSANMVAAAAAGLVWTEANLRIYLANPRELVPQGSMSFAGIRNPEQMNNLIAFLNATARATP